MIKFTAAFVDKLENILSESAYMVRYERGNFQSGWCLLDHKRVVVLNKFLNTEGRVNTLVDLIPQLKIDYDKLTLNSQKIYDFLAKNHIPRETETAPSEVIEQAKDASEAPVDSSDDEFNGEQDIKTDTENSDQAGGDGEAGNENTPTSDQEALEEVADEDLAKEDDDEDEDEDEDDDEDEEVENDEGKELPTTPQS